MGKIPVLTSQVAARSARPQGGLINTRSTPDDFGAQIGGAMQNLASGVDNFAAGLTQFREKQTQEKVANAVATSDYTQRELEIRNQTPADGNGYYKTVSSDYQAFVNENADKIDDPVARSEYKKRMLSQLPNVQSRSAQYEFTIAATNSKEQANAALTTLENKVTSDPTQYETFIKQGADVIEARPDLTPTLKESMKLTWRQNAAKSRFNGMLERATTVEEIDAIANELTGQGQDAAGPDERPPNWAKEFAPQDYERTINTIGNVRKAIITQADATARAALDTVQDRSKDVNTLIPVDELAEIQKIVKQSQNPVTVSRMARIMRDEDIKREERGLPPDELRARQAATAGNPGIAYPGLPARLSTAVNNAASKFGISASYLGATAQREYGQYLKVPRRGKSEFGPVAIHKGVDLRNMRSEAADMLAVAGELYGSPLQVTSGYRSQAKQDGIRRRGDPNRASVAKHSQHTEGNGADISTVGMSSADKARLVASLVDAGATGIGEYDTHVHADMRAAVPGSFGKDGGNWGGWTNLSPEVMAVLKERGFAAGLSSEQIQRKAGPVTSAEDSIDYGKPTSIVDDSGKPTSSAVGVGQFTTGTWMQVMRDKSVTARMGIDVSQMSDAQLLEMRKDPDVSMMVTAALAAQNKSTLERSLGRTVSDPELYMAHFLGSGGAMSLLTGLQNQPNQSAAELLPKAAAANQKIFYRNGKALTVQQVYNNIANQFTNQPSQVAFGDNETRKRLIDNADKQLKEDPVAYATQSGRFNASPLDGEGGFQQRGQEARAMAEFYSIPVQDMKPFTQEEVTGLHKQLKDGTVDDVLATMTAIQAMGGDMTAAALKQLEQKDSVFAYAAGLQYDRGNSAVASDIVRGQKRIEENPAIKNEVGAQDRDISDAFTKATGGALYEIDPRQRQAIQDAAFAHYIETVTATGAGAGFDTDAFTNSVQAVMGGTQGNLAVDDVNGKPTVLPRGLTGDDMEEAFQRMTVDDWATLSVQKLPPRYVNGDIINPQDLAEEATMRAIGGGKYKIMLDDGSFAITGEAAQNGRLEAYVFAPDEKAIKNIVTRPTELDPVVVPQDRGAIVNDDNTFTLGEQERIREQYGVLHQFDENGLWLGPAGAK